MSLVKLAAPLTLATVLVAAIAYQTPALANRRIATGNPGYAGYAGRRIVTDGLSTVQRWALRRAAADALEHAVGLDRNLKLTDVIVERVDNRGGAHGKLLLQPRGSTGTPPGALTAGVFSNVRARSFEASGLPRSWREKLNALLPGRNPVQVTLPGYNLDLLEMSH